MTVRKKENHNYKIGELLYNYRLRLTDISKSRRLFIDDRGAKFFGGDRLWISEKTLSNYETGKNVPSLDNLRKLAIALEVDINKLVMEVIELL